MAELCSQVAALETEEAVTTLTNRLDDVFEAGDEAVKQESANPEPADVIPPMSAVTANLDFREISASMKQRVRGQDHAIDAVVHKLAVFLRDLDARPERPNGVFLFAGPTGVGKTEMALALADAVYGSETNLIRIDMSEFYHPAEIARLTGSAPGYVGYDQPDSWLTTRIAKQPRAVLLLDEVEKAHPTVWNTFLQVFDAGVLTDGRGTAAHFRDITVIMTTNIGAEHFESKTPIGLVPSVAAVDSEEGAVRKSISEWFRPELVNRLDEVIVFKPLSTEALRLIAVNQLNATQSRLAESGYEMSVADELVDVIVRLGYNRQYGARPLLRVIESQVIAPLALEKPGAFSCQISGDEVTWAPVA
jgi:ATP-dependent Clp protease ATP-binding subunit ClpA